MLGVYSGSSGEHFTAVARLTLLSTFALRGSIFLCKSGLTTEGAALSINTHHIPHNIGLVNIEALRISNRSSLFAAHRGTALYSKTYYASQEAPVTVSIFYNRSLTPP